MAKCKRAPYQNKGVKPTRPKEIFGAAIAGPHSNSPSHFAYCLEIVVFIQDPYGYSYPLRKKSDAIQRLQDLVQRLYNAECYPLRI